MIKFHNEILNSLTQEEILSILGFFDQLENPDRRTAKLYTDDYGIILYVDFLKDGYWEHLGTINERDKEYPIIANRYAHIAREKKLESLWD